MRYHGRDLRKGRTSVSGQVYFITAVCHARRPIFVNMDAARVIVSALKHSDAAAWSRTLAFVVMPDHFHWLLRLEDSKTLSQLVGDIKKYSAHQLLKMCEPPVWQRGFHDHAVRAEEDLRKLARYIVANPLRADLVSSIDEYPWWDAVWLENAGFSL